jgi:hypothetical protein
MDNVVTPTADELSALMGAVPAGPSLGTSSEPPPEPAVSPPTPRVVERAKQMLAGEPEAPKGPQIPDAIKLQFLAHVLQDVPFKQTYTMFGGDVIITFRALTAAEDQFCKRVIAWEEHRNLGVAQDRNARYALYRCALACVRFDVHTIPRHLKPVDTGALDPEDLHDLVAEWQRSLSEALSRTLQGVHREFQDTLGELIAQAGTPHFWQTPS